MSVRNRMPPWHENFKLPNGHVLLLRPVRSEDVEPLQGVFALMGPQEIRERFAPSATGSSERFQQLTNPNAKREIVLVAAEQLPPGEAMIAALARAAIVPNSRHAEYIILVSSFVSGQGLGRQLLRKLVKWARGKYLDHLYGDILERNRPMLELAESLGFQRESHPESPDLVRMTLKLYG
ncbi:N-acetyltransferase family protein [Xylella fastidiosa subsp. sandyi]|uniref:GNAT family N-acetyltransferase n=1 Tax=Xylella fastidiosa subsp. fastidiosa TaxID=644356 RepID=A0AAJ5R0F3_XYLFS|nr:GNAT family N-acetyltransferase [Xylella fastidiosa]KQH74096.1 acyl-CoA synthetase [Xylella fastidiosa]RWA43869.1 N-acetyltransferase [Xylella fastidiosa subsp. sandyi]WCF28372.1 GNAT family N-acetyltransferase [Xylella fastidiosa subsp. fastidiosa]WNY19131.1 GNAT family N-acetyltransferase [Xylella fastidiosa]WNY21418.1 GNAT family N-acetyltransferase [Xylella fastidiosa]